MDEFFAGLKTWWATKTTDLFYVGIGGRLRNGIARQDETYPYCVFTQIDGFPEYFVDSGHDTLEFIEIQLDIYSESNAEVLALSKKAKSLFDNASFSVSGYGFIKQLMRTRGLLMPPEMTGLVGKTEFDFIVYRYLLTYEASFQKNRT